LTRLGSRRCIQTRILQKGEKIGELGKGGSGATERDLQLEGPKSCKEGRFLSIVGKARGTQKKQYVPNRQ